jgi:hypothetical protein
LGIPIGPFGGDSEEIAWKGGRSMWKKKRISGWEIKRMQWEKMKKRISSQQPYALWMGKLAREREANMRGREMEEGMRREGEKEKRRKRISGEFIWPIPSW